MEKQKVFDIVKEKILDQLPIDESRITESADLKDDLGADSANLMMLVMDLEEAFDTQVEDDAIMGIKTVGDIVNYIASRL